ncbi:type II toxin-antitoxin system Phd/YefM family antitoxin [Desulfovibrio piger]|uniref:type II toxin-antitoxin system Phd/YefM family antitoxin n=1 Tax=Desulfovibrio piger TaxID=901 RepID=UPI0026EF4AB4|nr:type II toxin-antitoxin system Phd/YefM family antitoxin [Desulfovibrio piger]
MSWTVTCAEAQENLATIMNCICDQHEPVIITRQSLPAVVMISLEDYEAIMETAHLLCSPANASRLREACRAALAGCPQKNFR